jgi:tetratricopeptide (TPR) repeat protein
MLRQFLPLALAACGCFLVDGQQLRADTREPKAETPPAAAPASTLSWEERADIFMARKMYREAIEAYQQQKPLSPVVLNKLGIAYHHLTDLRTAQKFYERSIKANPKYAEALNNLGTIFYAQKNYRKAIRYYKKALELTPRSASIHSNLGTAHFARKKYTDAFAEYEIALSLDPEVFEHRGTAGVLLQERSVEERAKFHFYLSKTYAKAGDTERALVYMRKAIEEGFKERSKFLEDADFASLRQLPEFEVLIKLEPRVL